MHLRRTCAWSVLLALVCLAPPARARAAVSAAPDTLRGVVTDASGMPLAGVLVELPVLGRSTRSGADGSFEIPGLVEGSWTTVFSRLGYIGVVRRLSASGPETVTRLTATAYEREPLIVTATRSPSEVVGSPLPASALSGDRLRMDAEVSLAHAVESLAGVRALSTGPQIGKPMIRGLTGARVLTLDAGNRMEDYAWSDEDGPSIDASLARRVEVVRGPASVLYGADAIGGVVNVIPADVPYADGTTAVHGLKVDQVLGSNNIRSSSVVQATGTYRRIGWRAGFSARVGGDLRTPSGTLENTGFGSVAAEAAAGMYGAMGSGTLRFAHYGGEFRLREAGGDPDERPERRLSDDRVQFHMDRLTGGFRLETRAQFQRHWLEEEAETATGTGGIAEQGLELVLNTLTAEAVLHREQEGGSRTSLGVSGLFQGQETEGVVHLVPPAERMGGALFGYQRYTVGRIDLLGGARFDSQRASAHADTALGVAAEDRTYSAVTGSVGAVLHLSDALDLVADVGRAWRAPDFFEVYADGPRLGEARYDRGDRTMGPETSLNLDVGLRLHSDRLRIEASVFRNAIDDYIFARPTTSFVGPLRVYQYEQAKARLEGAELAGELEANETFSIRGRLDVVSGERTVDAVPLPLVPPMRGDFEITWHQARQGGKYVTVGTVATAAKEDAPAGDIATKAWSVLNVDAGTTARLVGRTVHLDLMVHNLLDTAYRDYLSRYREFSYERGRDVVLHAALDLY